MTDQNTQAGSGNRNDDSVDSVDSVIDMLRAAASDESIPSEISGLDDGQDDKQGPAAHKFAEQQKRLKAALRVIDQQREQLSSSNVTSKRESGSGGGGDSAPPSGSRSQQDEAIYRALSMQACQNLGIGSREEAPRTFDLELARLWSDNAQRIERSRAAKESAPEFIRTELSKFEQLDDQDRTALTQRLQRLDVLQQTDPKVVRREVSSYLGDKVLSGSFSEQAGGGSPDDSAVSGDARPVGDTKNRGSSGVRPGSGAPRRGGDEPKPATPEERKAMKKLGIQDVAAYRAAQNKKDNYRGR